MTTGLNIKNNRGNILIDTEYRNLCVKRRFSLKFLRWRISAAFFDGWDKKRNFRRVENCPFLELKDDEIFFAIDSKDIIRKFTMWRFEPTDDIPDAPKKLIFVPAAGKSVGDIGDVTITTYGFKKISKNGNLGLQVFDEKGGCIYNSNEPFCNCLSTAPRGYCFRTELTNQSRAAIAFSSAAYGGTVTVRTYWWFDRAKSQNGSELLTCSWCALEGLTLTEMTFPAENLMLLDISAVKNHIIL